jgi:hypothetical protein
MARTFATTAKAAVGSLLAGSILMTAVPASAQHRGHRGNDRIDAGDVIAGAVVIGGLAAILSASNNRDRRYGDRGYDPRYDRGYDPRHERGYERDYRGGNQGGYDPRTDRDYGGYDRDGYGRQWRQYGARQAVQQCVVAAEQRASYNGSRADVRQVTEVERVRGGYQVRGTVAVDDSYGRYDRYDQRGGYDRGDRYDRRGYDDQGRFTCTVRYGQIRDIRVNGLG